MTTPSQGAGPESPGFVSSWPMAPAVGSDTRPEACGPASAGQSKAGQGPRRKRFPLRSASSGGQAGVPPSARSHAQSPPGGAATTGMPSEARSLRRKRSTLDVRRAPQRQMTPRTATRVLAKMMLRPQQFSVPPAAGLPETFRRAGAKIFWRPQQCFGDHRGNESGGAGAFGSAAGSATGVAGPPCETPTRPTRLAAGRLRLPAACRRLSPRDTTRRRGGGPR